MRQPTTINHPETGATSTVDARSVPGWQRAGWVVAGEEQAATTGEAPTADAAEPKPNRKRREAPTQIPAAEPGVTDATASPTE